VQDLTNEPEKVIMGMPALNKVGLIEVHLIRGTWSKGKTELPTAWEAADLGPVPDHKHK
jgi:hypothetical protein